MGTKGHEKFKGKFRLPTSLAGRRVQNMKSGGQHTKTDRLNNPSDAVTDTAQP